MPTYEYHCRACNRDFEVQKRISEPADQVCPICGSSETQRLISHSSFVLKGTGWYVTDYARKNGSNGSGGNGKSSKHGAEADHRGNGDSSTSSASPSKSDSSGSVSTSSTGSAG